MDIEGTTTSISFVHDVLFPYARRKILSFVGTHIGDKDIQKYLSAAAETINSEENTQYTTDDWPQIVTRLIHWIDEDRKHPALKGIQGILWEEGYKAGDYHGHVYDDVVPNWKRWKNDGKTLAIYSSGSVHAQKLLFGHSDKGDLNTFLSDYFDTAVGAKREASSYATISQRLGVAPSSILFLSDIPEELDAAKEKGFKTTQIIRPGTTPSPKHPTAATFDNLKI